MFVDELTCQIRRQLGFRPTGDQEKALQTFASFLTDSDPQGLMILRGSAGTGKTSLASAIVKALKGMKQKVVLLAPTGRAAKVFASHGDHPAFTIHRRIYRQKAFTGEGGSFSLNDNLHADTLFMVDEASMIANEGFSEAAFGSGRLLDDLVKYVYSGRDCRLMLIGDRAQLPPIGEAESPALCADIMEGYGLKAFECDLTEVLRQESESGILYNATLIRQLITRDAGTALPRIRFSGFADIRRVSGGELVEALSSSYAAVGLDETMVITRSNKRASIYNLGIRNRVLDREEELSTGDRLMVVRNNYYWSEKEKMGVSFIANGDRVRVQRVRNLHELYGFHFADVWLQMPDYDNLEFRATVIMESLTTDAPALTPEQGEELYCKVMEDYADIPQKAARIKQVRHDEHFNALQIKYAYAVTCHKAQGGQWAHIYLDQGYMADDVLTPDYIHWLYTAFTRATEKLFLVNWPREQTEETWAES